MTISDARPGGAAQAPLEVLGVRVPVDEGLGSGKPAAVDDAGVIQLIRADDLALAGESGDRAGVGEITRAEEQRGLGALERGQSLLELEVDRHRSREQPRRPCARAEAECGIGGGPAKARMVRQPEVVVRAEQQDRLPVEQHGRGLWAVNQAQSPAQPARFELLEPLSEVDQSPQPAGAASRS